jgi:hypothetical protein
MFERYGVWILALGALMMFAAWIWMVIRAFGEQLWWGLGTLLFAPLGFLFACFHWKRASQPAFLFLGGLAAVVGTYTASLVLANHVDLGKWETRVDGEIHVTLTNWDRKDYSFLKKRRDIVVLQMANPDVTDEVVAQLEGSVMLKEIDLDNTAITDKSLHILAAIPNLRLLRLRGTKITDEGFREHLLNKESLRSLDLRDTAVTSKTKREWKKLTTEERNAL